jgi:hypothetical protein
VLSMCARLLLVSRFACQNRTFRHN